MARILLNLFFSLILISTSYISLAQNTGSITGNVIEKSTQLPIIGAIIKINNQNISSANLGNVSDESGNFQIVNIPSGSYNLEVSYTGFKQVNLFNIVITTGNETNFSIELEEEITAINEVVIKASKGTVNAASIETPLSTQRLTTEEIKSNPGGNFDISKVIQTLPGVGGGPQGGSFRNDIIIRGGASNENVFYLDGIEVPVINHFQTQGSSGGPQGILNVSFIEDVKLSSSAFDAKYDNALSSVFQFKQKTGNPNQFQGNFRLSATDVSLTTEGPIGKNGNTTYLASVRRSYLQLLFQAIDLPIRPNYWDFQGKVTHKFNNKSSLTFIGIGAIDEFSFAAPKNSTPEKLYVINSNALINQWNYTFGLSFKKSIENGFYNLALSRTSFNNDIERFEDNEKPNETNQTLDLISSEIENKLRFDLNKTINGWKLSYGGMVQIAQYTNKTKSLLLKEIKDEAGQILQNELKLNFISPIKPFVKYGAFLQIGKRIFNNRMGVSAGIRTDMNSFTTEGNNGFKTLSPRISLSYAIANQWTWNSSVGRYFKIPPYTILGFANQAGVLVNKNAKYTSSNHFTSGFEYLPNDDLRFTLEGFYKKYDNVPVSKLYGISLSNLGNDFNVVGNEEIIFTGEGRSYGIEFYAQKKLTKNFFGILSYTFYKSEFSGQYLKFLPSSWDNRHLLSLTFGYKLPRNWEIGLKFRYQGGAPYTPFDELASRVNFLTKGQGTLNYSVINSERLRAFNNSDIRIDKKWNFKKTTLDLFLDVTNWYVAKNPAVPEYTFKRNAENTAFETTDGKNIKTDGSNAIPTFVKNDDPFFTPTIGIIIEF